MKKLSELRRALLGSGLGLPAKNLLSFAEKGRVRTWPGSAAQNRNMMIEYSAHLIITDYVGNPQDLLFVVARWMDKNVPDRTPEAFEFHVDILDHKASDVSIRVELRDTVTARETPAGTRLAFQPDADMRGLDLENFYPEIEP